MIPKIEGEGDTPIFSLGATYSTLIATASQALFSRPESTATFLPVVGRRKRRVDRTPEAGSQYSPFSPAGPLVKFCILA
jgi:hypothetical protein